MKLFFRIAGFPLRLMLAVIYLTPTIKGSNRDEFKQLCHWLIYNDLDSL